VEFHDAEAATAATLQLNSPDSYHRLICQSQEICLPHANLPFSYIPNTTKRKNAAEENKKTSLSQDL